MYLIKRVLMKGVWGVFEASVGFNKDVNILVGKNGSGKTNFLEILRAVLVVDISALDEKEFQSVSIYLEDDYGSSKTVYVEKTFGEDEFYPYINYKISRNSYRLRVVRPEFSRSLTMARRLEGQAEEIKSALKEIVDISSLSVHRFDSDERIEVSARKNGKFTSPVNLRLKELIGDLSKYQLELAQYANDVGAKLQKEALTSLLLGGENKDPTIADLWDFNKSTEKGKLLKAYRQLRFYDKKIIKKIDIHVNEMESRVLSIKNLVKKENLNSSDFMHFVPFEGMGAIYRLVDLALEAEAETEMIFKPIHDFYEILSSFMKNKKFILEGGGLKVVIDQEMFDVYSLSSGEKQVLIILIQALLQRRQHSIYMADEPELSLHIEWQRKIVPAIKEINPNSQVLVATHSPEIAGRYKEKIIKLEEVLSV